MTKLRVYLVLVAVSVGSATVRADIITDKLPYLVPGVSDMPGLMNGLASCDTVMKLPMGEGNASILGITIYGLNKQHPQAPKANAQAGVVFPPGGGSGATYIALDPSTMEAGDSLTCLASWVTIHHELHHTRWQLWIETQCAAATDPAKCKQCIALADACMKANDPTGLGDNGFEESRADFATALCLCKQACALPAEHPEKDVLAALAAFHFKSAQKHWLSGIAAW